MMNQDGKESLDLPHERSGSLGYRTHIDQMRRSHRHDELELNLVTDGTAAYLLGDRRYELRRNTLVWLFTEQSHILLDQSPNCHMWLGVFRPEMLHRICCTPETRPLLAGDPPGHYCRLLAEEEAAWLSGLFRRVADATDAATGDAGLGYALLAAWEAYRRTDEMPSGTYVHPAVEQAARLVRDETEPLSLEQIAACVGLSAPYLSLLFHRQTGLALSEFRNRQRVDRFLRFYGHGRRLSLLAAALEAGFGSYAQFHRVFKERLGYTPATYRELLRSQADKIIPR
jgi:AraC-like DNA-binding protein